jgi:hypothetical protein
MSGDPYYKQKYPWETRWSIHKRARHGGDRHMADGMSEAFATRVVKLLNDDEERNWNYPLPSSRELSDSEEAAESATWD